MLGVSQGRISKILRGNRETFDNIRGSVEVQWKSPCHGKTVNCSKWSELTASSRLLVCECRWSADFFGGWGLGLGVGVEFKSDTIIMISNLMVLDFTRLCGKKSICLVNRCPGGWRYNLSVPYHNKTQWRVNSSHNSWRIHVLHVYLICRIQASAHVKLIILWLHIFTLSSMRNQTFNRHIAH